MTQNLLNSSIIAFVKEAPILNSGMRAVALREIAN